MNHLGVCGDMKTSGRLAGNFKSHKYIVYTSINVCMCVCSIMYGPWTRSSDSGAPMQQPAGQADQHDASLLSARNPPKPLERMKSNNQGNTLNVTIIIVITHFYMPPYMKVRERLHPCSASALDPVCPMLIQHP